MAQLCRRKGFCIFSPYRPLLHSCIPTATYSSSSSSSSSASLIPSSLACTTSSQFSLLGPQSPWLPMKWTAQPSAAVVTSIFLARRSNFSTAAANPVASDYPSPTPPQEFTGSDVTDEAAEGADLNYPEDPEAMNDPSMYNMDANYGDAQEEEEGEYEEEEPAPDPEADALFSPTEDD